jgi:hypothetical protein
MILITILANLRERPSVCKGETKKFDVEKFNLKTLSEFEVREKCQIKTAKRFAALEMIRIMI